MLNILLEPLDPLLLSFHLALGLLVLNHVEILFLCFFLLLSLLFLACHGLFLHFGFSFLGLFVVFQFHVEDLLLVRLLLLLELLLIVVSQLGRE